MPIPLVGAALAAASRYLATKGVKAAAKKYGKAAIKTIKESEKGISSRAGSKKGLDAIKGTTTRNRGKGFGLKQAGTSKMATKAQRAANVSSGRKRIGTAATVGFLGSPSGDGEKNIKVDTSKRKVKEEKKVTPKNVVPVRGERKVTKKPKIELIYKVQIGTYLKSMLNNQQFIDLNAEELKINGTYKYFISSDKNKNNAENLKNRLRNLGFNGAFIIAFYEGKQISTKEALTLQNKLNNNE